MELRAEDVKNIRSLAVCKELLEQAVRLCDSQTAQISKLKAEKEELLAKFRTFIDDHCLTLVTATQAVENLSPNIQTDFYEEFIKPQETN
jgi:hypothetical protein